MSDSEQMAEAKSKSARRTKWISLVLMIIMIALFTVIHTSKTAPLAFQWEGDQFIVTDPTGKATIFQMATAKNIAWTENWELGEKVDGKESNGWYWGTWRNSAVGLYRQYAAVRCASRVVITWPEETLCIAMESDETTKALAAHLTEMIAGAQKE